MLWAVCIELAAQWQPKGTRLSRETQVHVYTNYLLKDRDVTSLVKFVTVLVDFCKSTVVKILDKTAIVHVF